MKRYLIEVELSCMNGFKGVVRNPDGYRRFIEKLRKNRELGKIVTQKVSFEWDFKVDPPIDYYLGNPVYKVTEL